MNSKHVVIYATDQKLHPPADTQPVLNIQINNEMIEILCLPSPYIASNRRLLVAISDSTKALLSLNKFFTARLYQVYEALSDDNVLKSSGSQTYTEYFMKIITEVKNFESIADQCLKVIDFSNIKNESKDSDEVFYSALRRKLIEVLLNQQFSRYTTNNIQFSIAHDNVLYRKCFDFLLKNSGGLFNFYGRKLYNSEKYKFIQCRNQFYFSNSIEKKNNKYTKQYIAEQSSDNILSLMIYCTIGNVGHKVENDILHIHACDKKNKNHDLAYKNLVMFAKQLKLQQDQIKQIHGEDTNINIIGAANLLLIENNRIVILNGLAVHKGLYHNHIGTQILEHCLYTVNPRPLVAYVPLELPDDKSAGLYSNAMRACNFFKAACGDENTAISSASPESAASPNKTSVNSCECMKFILLNKK